VRYFIYEQRRLVSDCRTIEYVSQDHVERFSRLDKELLNVSLMYNEVVDGMLNPPTRERDRSEVPENPIKRSIDLVKAGHARIYRIGSHLHKQTCVVKSAGKGKLQGYCEIEMLDFHGVPNGSAYYMPACHLRPVADYSWDDSMKSEIQELKRANRELENQIETLKSVQTKRVLTENHQSRLLAQELPRMEPDLRMSAADGAGAWKNAVENPYKCTICIGKYKSSHGFAVHCYNEHGGDNNTRRMKHCNDLSA
jgi:hypothetical protein